MSAFVDALRSPRVSVMLLLGLASGLPYLMTGSTLNAWMTVSGVDLTTIGIFALVGIPYSVKFLWAPLLDRFRLPWLGRRRGWMALAQLLLLGAIAAMGTVSPRLAPHLLALFAVIVAFSSASLDIVSDAYRTEVLRPAELGSGAAVFVAAYRVALIVAGAGALMLADAGVDWTIIYAIIAGLMMVGLIGSFTAPSPESEPPVPQTLTSAFVQPLLDLLRRPAIALTLAVVALYKVGDAVAAQMVPTFLIKTGFSLLDIGAIVNGFGIGATILGCLLGVSLVDRLGLRRSLFWFGLAAATANLFYLGLALTGPRLPLLVAAVGIDNIFGGLATAAFVAYLMALCSLRYTATQYALLSSASSLVGRLLSAASGWVAERVGWPTFFALTVALAVPALILLWLHDVQRAVRAER